ncbi:hypothetical protein [Burkholderia gladioli]|uniref:hypothetical protein n=1 Tax=Burkholderia gladioli TaxID=28095 RepID=UPI00163E0B43|nr:hypothetical protein [Burkholderia gladioli]MBJ9673353.1 hypothetical protein [Burkholderia gladioli]MDN7464168.1 hypothetical protein [Burkholderia gladioli]
MLPYDNFDARETALRLVTTALQSEAIKLDSLRSMSPKEAGKNDAEYLASLITTLADKLEGK